MAEPGLCGVCRHARVVETGRSSFYLCERSFTDPRFPKYPPLPVVACVGFEVRSAPPPEEGKGEA